LFIIAGTQERELQGVVVQMKRRIIYTLLAS